MTWMPRVLFIAIELLLLAVAHRAGGPLWTVITVIGLVSQLVVQIAAGSFRGFRPETLAPLVPGLLWIAAFHATGNRELFFPYSIYLAGCAAVCGTGGTVWPGSVGGFAVVAGFMIIRILQQATARVLVVEFVVAVAILAAVLGLQSRLGDHHGDGRRAGRTALIAAAASLLAYASLAL